MGSKFITGKAVEAVFKHEILPLVISGLKPLDDDKEVIPPPGSFIQLWYRDKVLREAIAVTEKEFPQILSDGWGFLRGLGKKMADPSFDRNAIIDFADGTNSKIRVDYVANKKELEYIEDKLSRDTGHNSWDMAIPYDDEEKKIFIDRLLNAFYEYDKVIEMTGDIPEQFIRTTTISFKNESEIKIRGGFTRLNKSYSKTDLGFKKRNAITWTEFIKILRSPDNLYRIGKMDRTETGRRLYDQRQKVLSEINKKFVDFFLNTYKVSLPKSFRIYERVDGAVPGTYQFKFNIQQDDVNDSSDLKSLTQDVLISTIEKLVPKMQELSNRAEKQTENLCQKLMDRLNSAVTIALDNKWISTNQAIEYLQSTSVMPPSQA